LPFVIDCTDYLNKVTITQDGIVFIDNLHIRVAEYVGTKDLEHAFLLESVRKIISKVTKGHELDLRYKWFLQ